jgi:hypothetical protein
MIALADLPGLIACCLRLRQALAEPAFSNGHAVAT